MALHPEHPRYNDTTYPEPYDPVPPDEAYDRALFWAEQDALEARRYEEGQRG